MGYALKNPTGPASEAAFNFAVKLVREAPGASKSTRLAVLRGLADMNAQQISDLIDTLKTATKTTATSPQQKPADATAQAVPGHYMIDGEHYIVKKSKVSGYSYLCNAWGGYLGAKGGALEILAKIVANGKEYAIAYAKVTSKCGICNTKLTDPKSIAAGIGPVCAEKF